MESGVARYNIHCGGGQHAESEEESRRMSIMSIFNSLADTEIFNVDENSVVTVRTVQDIAGSEEITIKVIDDGECGLYEVMRSSIPKGWESVFESNDSNLRRISSFVSMSGYYPLPQDVFAAFHSTPLDRVRVVIVGQDPYPQEINGRPRATGHSFSVRMDDSIPASLLNIFKEIRNEYPDFTIPSNGDLSGWTEQGVLLLNKSLTYCPEKPKEHRKAWMPFISSVVKAIIAANPSVVFVLWGKDAQELVETIGNKVTCLVSAHPSSRNARGGFFDNNHFIEINRHLTSSFIKRFEKAKKDPSYQQLMSLILSRRGVLALIEAWIALARFKLVESTISNTSHPEIQELQECPGFGDFFNFISEAASIEIDWKLTNACSRDAANTLEDDCIIIEV